MKNKNWQKTILPGLLASPYKIDKNNTPWLFNQFVQNWQKQYSLGLSESLYNICGRGKNITNAIVTGLPDKSAKYIENWATYWKVEDLTSLCHYWYNSYRQALRYSLLMTYLRRYLSIASVHVRVDLISGRKQSAIFFRSKSVTKRLSYVYVKLVYKPPCHV